MIAMQYGFTLPADYDMAIIDRRIADKGKFTDGFPGLVFKAYLITRKTDPLGPGENRYAPFYLWESASAMNTFLCGPGFAAVTQSFGWPMVNTWSAWWSRISDRVAEARFASIELMPVQSHANLGELQAAECRLAAASMETEGALAAVAGFNPSNWNVVRLRLWKRPPPSMTTGTIYAIGHLSQGELNPL
jgi:hypothetical protein